MQEFHQKLGTNPENILIYLEELLTRFHSKSQVQTLLAQYKENDACIEDCSADFSWMPELTDADFQVDIPEKIPVIIIARDFRGKEYKESEYWTSHPQSQLLLCGDNHYLHWTEIPAICQVIAGLLG